MMTVDITVRRLRFLPAVLLAAMLPLALVSCGDDSAEENATVQGIQIQESSVFFPSQGGEGHVVVEANGAVDASLTATWCHASVSGKTVTLTADQNPTIEGRSALLTLTADGHSVKLTVQQRGIVYNFPHRERYIFGDTAVSGQLPIEYDNQTTVSTSAQWLRATIDGNTVRYEADANDTQRIRSAWLRISSGQYSDSLKILQYDAKTDLLGRYCLAGYEADGSLIELKGTLAYTGKTLYLRIPDRSWNIALGLDSVSPTLHLKSMEYAGRHKTDSVNYYVTLLTAPIVDNNFQIYMSSSYGMKALLDYDETTKTTLGRFEDDGSWKATGLTPNAISFWLSKGRPATLENSVGSLGGIAQPYIYRIE